MVELGNILHELVDAATGIIDNRKGALHDAIDAVVGSLVESLNAPAPKTPAAPADGPAKP